MTNTVADVRAASDDELLAMYQAGNTEEVINEAARRDRNEKQNRKNRDVTSAWTDAAHSQMIAAEAACAGTLVRADSPVADAWSLWSGSHKYAMAHASEELRNYWLDHPRLTVGQYRQQISNGRRVQREERATAGHLTVMSTSHDGKGTEMTTATTARKAPAKPEPSRPDTRKRAPRTRAPTKTRTRAPAKTPADTAPVAPHDGKINGRMAAYIKSVNVQPDASMAKRQDLDVMDTPLADAFDALSIFSASTFSQRLCCVVWAASTQVKNLFAVHPRLSFAADGPGCGKSTHLKAVLDLSREPKKFSYSTPAATYGYLDEHPNTTLGVDQADTLFGTTGRARGANKPLLTILLDGYDSEGSVLTTRGGKAVDIPCYVCAATAGIGVLPGDLLTRCIVIHLEKGQAAEEYDAPLYRKHMQLIATNLGDWLTTDEANRFLRAQPKRAQGLDSTDPRFLSMMAPLCAVANLASIGEQFTAAVNAVLSGLKENPPMTLSGMAVAYLREVWPNGSPRLSAIDLAALLRTDPDERWAKQPSQKPADIDRWIAGLLGEFGIRSKSNGKWAYDRRDVFSVVLS